MNHCATVVNPGDSLLISPRICRCWFIFCSILLTISLKYDSGTGMTELGAWMGVMSVMGNGKPRKDYIRKFIVLVLFVKKSMHSFWLQQALSFSNYYGLVMLTNQ